MNPEADALEMLAAGASAPVTPEQCAGIIAHAVHIFLHPQAADLPPERLPRFAIAGQLACNQRAWVVAWHPLCPVAFIRPPIYATKSSRPNFGMKSIDFRQWDAVKVVLDAGLRIEGHEVPATVKPEIRDAYEAWKQAQWGPHD